MNNNEVHFCYYCNAPAKYQLKNGKWYCNQNPRKCPKVIEKIKIGANKNWKAIKQLGFNTKHEAYQKLKNNYQPNICFWCKQPAKYHFKNGKWCCSKNTSACPQNKRKISEKVKQSHKKYPQKFSHSAWNKGLTKETSISLKNASKTFKYRLSIGQIIIKGHSHTQKTKKLLSEKQKLWLKNNPDKHPWKKLSKFKSAPCEKLKEILKNNNLEFVSEFSDLNWEHNYSIDIAFPNNKIGLEVNGNQHYNKNKSLTKYFKQREKYLISVGWKIYQIHYSLVYNQNFIFELINKIKKDIN